MEAFHLFIILISFGVSLLPLSEFSSAAHINSITPTQSLIDDGNATTLVSGNQTSVLGFFSPGNSNKRYLGIWYKRKPETTLWVANRNSPLNDSNGEFTIREGNLVLLSSTRSLVWSSNVSSKVANSTVALLSDFGNLILKEQESTSQNVYLWQSFDYPTDSLLSGMKLGWDNSTRFERYLTSWKSTDDPSTGNATFRISIISGLPQAVLVVGSTPTYRTGIWNGVRFSGVKSPFISVFDIFYVFDENNAYMKFEITGNSTLSLVKVNPSGLGEQLIMQDNSSDWSVMYTLPADQNCESYNYCGANAVCTSTSYPVCECLKGFTPRSEEEWKGLTWSKGCVRRTPLDCQKGEGFVKVAAVKLPDLLDFSYNKNTSLKECKEACSKNCSCIAYANSDVRNGGSGCLMWFGNLIDMRDIAAKGSEQDLYIRLSSSDMKAFSDANKKKKLKIILSASLTSGTLVFGLAFWCIATKIRKRKNCQSIDEDIDLPIFDLPTITAATNGFSSENKIGAGGYGPVYKGRLSTGQEIAVKRLSKNSGQGLKEFKNEVELIAKLQHRNLVALLGCCVEAEEKMLIYEYMPQKSLDHFIFDGTRSTILPWNKHFNIIRGIGRGLLYLHQDSKLQIVHRDLKASNILLDNNLNPKISDFGLARPFRDDENEARTKRVVGTYGYMSPEYAIDGKFSIKSDVFSFGVILLETVSGKKNRNFNHPDHNHNLLGHAWLLWDENRPLDLMDVCFNDSCVESQVLRCIQVGLLCVQKFPNDRPTMSSVVFMLENDGALLPEPKLPGFFVERNSSDEASPSRTEDPNSEILITVSLPTGR
ncbi:G-type lectin S-receptor-like serine/threonine-protein kinase At4g27290 [Morus notabilis]|uniref:G-type lectin S-receptor-like serine/threonine-protein kinase At4g27290 n=1 Tax=Morus notabilis TaxID=981085 RepID=UPI000CED6B94|nr:G-type lectin S-receptor-like serine/threonine-protein kinase At4g27290 [Morus notabilis]